MILKTTNLYFRVDRREISFIKFIYEACDGITMLSTIDAAMGIVKFAVPPGCEDEFHQVLSDLKKQIRIEPWQYEAQPAVSQANKV